MAPCHTCGNSYDKSFDIIAQGERYTFDSFECATHALAPTCAQCGCKIVGHGSESDGTMYCCSHCAAKQGVHELQDRADDV